MFNGALCAFSVVALIQSLRTPGGLVAGRRSLLRDAAGLGAAIVVAFGMARGFDSLAVVLAIAAVAFLMPRFARAGGGPAFWQSAIALAALGAVAMDLTIGLGPESLQSMATGGAVAVGMAYVAGRVRLPVLSATLQRVLCFTCAALCTVIAYIAGLDEGALPLVILSAMVALIGAFLAMALIQGEHPALVSALNSYAACCVVALGIAMASGVLIVTGVLLVLGGIAMSSRESPARASLNE
jgi:NAD/NADP transhydrogenase beta subunit